MITTSMLQTVARVFIPLMDTQWDQLNGAISKQGILWATAPSGGLLAKASLSVQNGAYSQNTLVAHVSDPKGLPLGTAEQNVRGGYVAYNARAKPLGQVQEHPKNRMIYDIFSTQGPIANTEWQIIEDIREDVLMRYAVILGCMYLALREFTETVVLP